MADLNDLNKPDGASNYSTEVWQTVRGHVARLWSGDYTGMGNLVAGMRRWVRVGTTDVKLMQRNSAGAEDVLFDSSLKANAADIASALAQKPKIDGTGATGSWPIGITGNAATATTAGSCTGNAATATTAGSCTGNAATATTASSCTGNAATVSTVTTAQVGSAISQLAAGAIGSYVMAAVWGAGIQYGSIVSGDRLRVSAAISDFSIYSSTVTVSAASNSPLYYGSWMCMGHSGDMSATNAYNVQTATLWLRVA